MSRAVHVVGLACVIALQTGFSREIRAEGSTTAAPNDAARKGLSKESAIVVGAKGEVGTVKTEYKWIAENYPNSKPLEQSLTAFDEKGRRFDVITIRTSAGQELDLWFDITSLYAR
jgi:hypothetical protein